MLVVPLNAARETDADANQWPLAASYMTRGSKASAASAAPALIQKWSRSIVVESFAPVGDQTWTAPLVICTNWLFPNQPASSGGMKPLVVWSKAAKLAPIVT